MKSLYFRVFLITLLTVLVSSLLGFLLSNFYYHVKLKPFNDTKLVRMAEDMRRYVQTYPDQMDAYFENTAALGYELYLTDGTTGDRFYGKSFRARDLSSNTVKEVVQGTVYHGVAKFPNKPFISGFFDNRLSNTVGVPVQIRDHRYALFMRPDVLLQFGELRIFFALIGGLTVALSILFFLFSTRYLVHPITRLTQATRLITEGQYRMPLPLNRKDEIGRLAHHFKLMASELERSEQARQQFVSNVSHEIQTPLTSIQGFALALSKEELTEEERARYATIIAEESGHLSALAKQLLTLSSLDQSAGPGTRQPIHLRTQIRQVVQVLEWQLTDKELALRIAVPDTLHVAGDAVLLSQVWMNLLANAVKYTPQGGAIEIRAEEEGTSCLVRVMDSGGGIPEADRPFVFDRFYRSDQSRERATGGAGLGLSIVKRIVHLHGGTIELAERPEGGTVFSVKLPNL